jgi:chitodextrinase
MIKTNATEFADFLQGKTWPCGKIGGGWQKYYGRGAKQLSYNYNYGPFSDAMFGDVNK